MCLLRLLHLSTVLSHSLTLHKPLLSAHSQGVSLPDKTFYELQASGEEKGLRPGCILWTPTPLSVLSAGSRMSDWTCNFAGNVFLSAPTVREMMFYQFKDLTISRLPCFLLTGGKSRQMGKLFCVKCLLGWGRGKNYLVKHSLHWFYFVHSTWLFQLKLIIEAIHVNFVLFLSQDSYLT